MNQGVPPQSGTQESTEQEELKSTDFGGWNALTMPCPDREGNIVDSLLRMSMKNNKYF